MPREWRERDADKARERRSEKEREKPETESMKEGEEIEGMGRLKR